MMRRLSQRLLVLLLMFLIGWSATRLYRHWFITFRPVAYGVVGLGPGGLGEFTRYESDDDTEAVRMVIRFSTAAAADEAFQTELRRMSRITERKYLGLDGSGNLIGEQAHAVLLLPDPVNPERSFLIKRAGDRLEEICSPSPRHLRALETLNGE